MYGQTLSQLNRYFEQPVLTGYYLTAERLCPKPGRGPREREVAVGSAAPDHRLEAPHHRRGRGVRPRQEALDGSARVVARFARGH